MPSLLPVVIAAKKYRISERQCRKLAGAGLGERHGRRWMVREEALRRYERGLPVSPPSAPELGRLMMRAGQLLANDSKEAPPLVARVWAELLSFKRTVDDEESADESPPSTVLP